MSRKLPAGGQRLAPEEACARAQECARRGDDREAEKILQTVISESPDHAPSLHELGLLKVRGGDGEAALRLLRRAAVLAPDEARYFTALGAALKRFGQLFEAEEAYRWAAQLLPDEAAGHFDHGLALQALERHGDAEAAYRRTLEIKPDHSKALNNLGSVLRQRGCYAESEEVCRRALEAAPDYFEALYNLALVHRFQPRDPLISELERQLARHSRSGHERTHLLVALGKAHDDIGHYEKAFAYYRRANEASASSGGFDGAAQRDQIVAVKSAFPKPFLCPTGMPGAVSPIFVVGMSRSGKTLVESLLAQHPAVIGAGEGEEWFQALRRVLQSNGISGGFPACLGALSPVQICDVGDRYLEQLRRRQQLPGARLFVNTMPGHYSHVGLFFRAFPSVKVIYCQRDPLDLCLRAYFKIFTQGHEYSNDLRDLATYYRNYEDMMAYWLRLYGQRIFTMRYETLVRDPAEAGRRLYAYCGLDFAPGKLHADFATDQIGDAANYATQLAPLRAALGT